MRSSLDVVAAETDRLERLVGDVLDLAKLQAHRFTVRHEEVDLGRVLDHAYGAFAEEARRREIDYRLDGDAEAPVIVSDGDRVLQVISNLLSNAFRWTPDGGRIELALAAANGAVRVDVVDSGPGVPADERERHLRPVHLARRQRDGARTPDRAGARARARRADRARVGRSAAGAGSGSCCRRQRPSSYAAATRWAPTALRLRSRARPRFALEPLEPRIDATPARAHEVDEQREVVHTRVPLGERALPRAARAAGSPGSSRPRTSAMWRATGRTSVRSPSRTATQTCAGIDASRSAAATGERLDLDA